MRIPIILQDTSVLVDVAHYEVVCPTCKTRNTEFGRREARRLGREAAQTIFSRANADWYDGLLEELATLDPRSFKHAARLGWEQEPRRGVGHKTCS